MDNEEPRLTRKDIQRLKEIEEQRLAVTQKKIHKEEKKEWQKQENFYLKEKKKLRKQELKTAARSRITEKQKINERSSFLTKAILIIILLLAGLLACAFFL
ncbi:MAG: cell wall synthase accessory phosphoprotein MacP [Lactobacillales bacterium]|nr:cell wall synthase accessory phosphoprotein MacP [Lactobacillales bacterium]